MGRGNKWTLNGKTALVTGSTKGIGWTVAEELASLGATVSIVARRREEVDAQVKKMQNNGFEAFGIAADVTLPENRKQMLKVAEEATLVNGF